MNIDTIMFGISALVAIFGAVMMIGQRNPIASVLYFIVSLVAQAVLYVQLGALFLGVVLIIVYAGAIMVLFLFVIMLLNLRGSDDFGGGSNPVSKFTKFLIAGLLAVELGFVVRNSVFTGIGSSGLAAQPESFGSVETVAKLIFTKYLYPFELTSILLLVAIVGAVMLAGRARGSEAGEPDEDTTPNPPIEEVRG